MKNNITELVFILDRSGSMAGLESDTIGGFNALSVFTNETNATPEMRILTAILLTVITGSYALYLAFSMKGKTND